MPSCRVCLSVCVSVCLSRSWVVSKRINISSKFFSPSIHPASHRVATPFYTVSQKNVPALESCSFDKHGLILIIFDTQHQHTFENDTDFNFPCPFTFTYFICFLIAATEMTRSDVPLCSWTVQKYRTLSLQICIRQTVRLTTEFVDWCRNVCIHCTITCPRYQPLWPAWRSASLTHGQAYHKTSSTKQFVNDQSDYVQAWGKRTSLTSASLKLALFRANTRHNRLFAESATV